METQQMIDARARNIERGLEAAFGVKAKSLDKALRKTGRRLPRRLRSDARRIVDAQRLGGHPKLMKQVDGPALDAAEVNLTTYLNSIDRADARKGRLLSLAGAVAFNILVVAGGYIGWMVWAGKV